MGDCLTRNDYSLHKQVILTPTHCGKYSLVGTSEIRVGTIWNEEQQLQLELNVAILQPHQIRPGCLATKSDVVVKNGGRLLGCLARGLFGESRLPRNAATAWEESLWGQVAKQGSESFGLGHFLFFHVYHVFPTRALCLLKVFGSGKMGKSCKTTNQQTPPPLQRVLLQSPAINHSIKHQ